MRLISLFTDDKENIYAGLECDNINYTILGYNAELEEAKVLNVHSKNKLSVVSFSLLKNGNPVVDGLWSPKTPKEAHGFFSIVVDKETFEQTNKNFKPFTNQIFAKNRISEAAAAKGKGIKEVGVVKGVADEKGNFFRVFEIYYSATTSNGNFRGYEENIFIVKYNELGEIQWQDILLRKNVYNNGEYYMSYKPLILNGEFIVLYNGHSLNLNVQEQKKCKNVLQGNFGYMTTFALKYNDDGKAKQEVFCEYKNRTFMYSPKNFRKFNDNLLFVEQNSRPAVRGRYIGKYGIYKIEEE